jgi:hypothetical protein
MLQRRRRTTRFQVETLEGRAAPAITATSALLVLTSPKEVWIRGYTTRPTHEGDRVEIKATEHLASGRKIEAFAAVTEVKPSIFPDSRIGVFSANVDATGGESFSRDGTFTVVAINIGTIFHPHESDRTTSHEVPITVD